MHTTAPFEPLLEKEIGIEARLFEDILRGECLLLDASLGVSLLSS